MKKLNQLILLHPNDVNLQMKLFDYLSIKSNQYDQTIFGMILKEFRVPLVDFYSFNPALFNINFIGQIRKKVLKKFKVIRDHNFLITGTTEPLIQLKSWVDQHDFSLVAIAEHKHTNSFFGSSFSNKLVRHLDIDVRVVR